MSPLDVIERRERWHLEVADSGDVLPVLPDECVDALVTDPPAGIGFMGKDWDGDKGGRDEWVAWLAGVMRECLRVLKPGAHGLVWALPRTSHWTGWALESAGFEVRDRVAHLFGTGFPKSLNLGDGRGTALKPACEDWWLVRKPLAGTVARNVAEFGTGALNIDACRIGTSKNVPASQAKATNRIYGSGMGSAAAGIETSGFDPNVGRWPANVTLDEEAAALLDEQSGTLKSGEHPAKRNAKNGDVMLTGLGAYEGRERVVLDSGGASRFFYVAKPDGSERDVGCEDAPTRTGGEATGRRDGSAGLKSPRAGSGRTGGRRNIHPTVKSVDLMRWLLKLITPPGGVVLDPFAGSGSTGVAAIHLGRRFIGIEQNPEYVEIARGRIEAASPGQTLDDYRAGQLSLLEDAR